MVSDFERMLRRAVEVLNSPKTLPEKAVIWYSAVASTLKWVLGRGGEPILEVIAPPPAAAPVQDEDSRRGWFDRQAHGIADDKQACPDWMRNQSDNFEDARITRQKIWDELAQIQLRLNSLKMTGEEWVGEQAWHEGVESALKWVLGIARQLGKGMTYTGDTAAPVKPKEEEEEERDREWEERQALAEVIGWVLQSQGYPVPRHFTPDGVLLFRVLKRINDEDVKRKMRRPREVA